MRHKFYNSTFYKQIQSENTKKAWLLGQHNSVVKPTENRVCKNIKCKKSFQVKEYDPKQFCSMSCAGMHNNLLRRHSVESRTKISKSLTGKISSRKGKIIVPRLDKICLNCEKQFQTHKWQNKKYCSVRCSIGDIGKRNTSPKAARGKSGIRSDIDPGIYFYSRWEANFARILNLLSIEWIFQYKKFDIGAQNYTPDFYLSDSETYVEIKNFMSPFSSERDKKFRESYPNEKLILVLKNDYNKLQEEFANLIPNWEYS